MYCPNCGKEIEEGSKFCKYCGAKVGKGEIDVKEKEVQQARETVPSYDAPKMIPQDMLKEGEKIVFETHPHKVYTLLGSWIFGAILVLVGIAVFFASVLAGIIVEVIAFLVFLISYFKWRYTIYGLTTGRVIRLSGVIGKDLYENPLERIQDLRLKMGVIQRMFGCGDIMITTAGTAVIECAWKNIANPRKVQKTLRTLLGRREEKSKIMKRREKV